MDPLIYVAVYRNMLSITTTERTRRTNKKLAHNWCDNDRRIDVFFSPALKVLYILYTFGTKLIRKRLPTTDSRRGTPECFLKTALKEYVRRINRVKLIGAIQRNFKFPQFVPRELRVRNIFNVSSVIVRDLFGKICVRATRMCTYNPIFRELSARV